jgi:hypothetical protein
LAIGEWTRPLADNSHVAVLKATQIKSREGYCDKLCTRINVQIVRSNITESVNMREVIRE